MSTKGPSIGLSYVYRAMVSSIHANSLMHTEHGHAYTDTTDVHIISLREEGHAMILEVAMLRVRDGQGDKFEAAFRQASPLIASTPGYISHELHHCIEAPMQYLLLVRWNTVADHTIGFRGSSQYQAWKQLLHHFYDPFPTVEHFECVLSTTESSTVSPRKPEQLVADRKGYDDA